MIAMLFGFCFALTNSLETKADVPAPDKEGACGWCLFPNGTWGADIDCWNGQVICQDSVCTSGWC